jgi:aspartate-semialdehyde dehydrogenase
MLYRVNQSEQRSASIASPEINIGVIGPTGLVGHKMLEQLDVMDLTNSIRLFASPLSSGNQVHWRDQKITLENPETANLEGLDIALISAGSDVALDLTPRLLEAGAVVIDNSSAFRSDPDIPLVGVGVNNEDVADSTIIANPNCSTAIVVEVIKLLHDYAGIESAFMASYQAISGLGKRALEEFHRQTLGDACMIGKTDDKSYRRVQAHADFGNLAYTVNNLPEEAVKIQRETRKILHLPDLAIGATCKRVPVPNGHTIVVSASFERPTTVEGAYDALSDSEYVTIHDNPNPYDASGQNAVLVGNIDRDRSRKNGLTFTVSGDNLLRGAALNAVEIAQLVIARMNSAK